MSIQILGRFRAAEFSKGWSPVAALFMPGRQLIGSFFVLLMLLGYFPQPSHAAENLECPDVGSNSFSALVGDVSAEGLFVTENRVDLANEINEAINRLQIASPDVSWTDAQNVLVAAYCRVVARQAGLAAAENGAVCASSTRSCNNRSQRT